MSVYTNTFDIQHIVQYRDLLKEEGCTFLVPNYTFFQAKTKDWLITFYKSGKVVVQGKDIDHPVKKFFEKETLNLKIEKASVECEGEIAPYPHIGIDESGKGDFFGPLVAAGCYLTEENAKKLKEAGAMDSKKLDDKKILSLSNLIKANSIFDIIVIGNKKYNELYYKFNNLNHMLAWAHASVLENILQKTPCKIAISDKFADERVILSKLKEKGRMVNLIQQTKAEKDTAVACASILARGEFVKRISKLSYEYDIEFPKGAGEKVLAAGKIFISKFNTKELENVSKVHFKTYKELLG